MKLKVLKEDFAKAVAQVSRFVNPRVQLPILGNIVISATKTKLNLIATNLELSISKELGADITEEGEIAVPGRILNEIVVNLPKGQVELGAEKEQLKLKAEGFVGSVAGMATADFPKITRSLGRNYVDFPGSELVAALFKVAFCVSVDETRPVLNGVLFLFKKKELVLVATDGFRLSQKTLKLTKEAGLEKVILPRAIIGEILKTESNAEINFELKEKENQAVFGVGDTVLSSRVISGEFPNFEQIIPKTILTKIYVDKEELLRVVKLASVFARDNANMVKFEVLKDSLKVSAESAKSGVEEATLEAKVEGEEMEITFNYRFLEELLNVIDGDEVAIELTNTTSPGVFRDPKDPDFLHLIMPVKIQA